MDDLCDRLKQWGHATVARTAHQHDGPSAGVHILSKNQSLAPGTKERAKAALLGRSGVSRRTLMAKAANAGLDGRSTSMDILPMCYCDPIPARNDAGRPRDLPKAWVDIGLPDQVLPIDRAIRALEKQFPLRFAIIREEYTGTGTQKMKAKRVQAAYGGKLTINQYRHELRRAQDWLRGRAE